MVRWSARLQTKGTGVRIPVPAVDSAMIQPPSLNMGNFVHPIYRLPLPILTGQRGKIGQQNQHAKHHKAMAPSFLRH